MLTGIHDALLIHNPAAGRQRQRAHELGEARQILAEAGIAAEIADTSRAGEATQLARQAAAGGRGLVIACGGDGTINEVANGLAGSQTPLAILPAGTANVLGLELAIPWDIPGAARKIATGRLARIALGLALAGNGHGGAGRYFVCIAGAGVDGSMVYRLNPQLKEATGTLAYWMAGLEHFFRYKLSSFPVAVDGRAFRAAQVVVGRTKYYGGPFRITARADLFSDRFEVAVFTSTSRFRYPSHMMAVLQSRLGREGDVHLVAAQRVLCEGEPGTKIYAEIDGEPAGTLPMEFRVVPDALTLVVPEGEAGQGRADGEK